jgi:hypothetical protein
LKRRSSIVFLLLLLSVGAFVLQGYHPGAEDDGVYLTAIHKDLDPSLYPYNSIFFTLQMQATIFDKLIASSVKWTHLPLPYVALGWQFVSIALLLAGCWKLCSFCFDSFRARLAGVLSIACLLTLPVAGTALYISDEHLHPRLLATDAILFAIAAMQRRRPVLAALLLIVAFVIHPMMALFGISFVIIFTLVRRMGHARVASFAQAARSALPRQVTLTVGAWLFSSATPAWREAVAQHAYYRLSGWTWYEWLGALAPPLLLALLARLARRRGRTALFQIAAALAIFSVVQLGIALSMLLPPGFERLVPLQPMRYLHLTFLLMALLAGATLGEYVLKARVGLWLLVFVPLAGVNGYAQRTRYPATRNLELPWLEPQNQWLQAFHWVRSNTPTDAVFAMDPHYLGLPGEDNHSFRALAERSSLADDEKDAAVATQVPMIADLWLAQQREQKGWRQWKAEDFLRLAETTPVNWVLVVPAQAAGLHCPYANPAVSVCRLR